MNKAFHDLSRGAALAALLGLAAGTVAIAAPLYRIVPVSHGDLPRDAPMQATRINDAGILVGFAEMTDSEGELTEYPVRWSADGMPHVDRVHWGYTPTSINRAGAVLAFSNGNPGADQVLSAVWFDGRAVSSYPVDSVRGNDINADFLATGGESWFDAQLGMPVHTAVVFDRARHVRVLPTLGGTRADGHAINDAGDVVGQSTIAGDAEARAFLYRGGSTIDLQAGAGSVAWDINLAGLVVGHRQAGGGWQVFAWRDGQMSDVGVPFGQASGSPVVNDAGTIAWSALDGGGAAFVSIDGTSYDINRCLTPDSAGWHVVEVDDMNSAGVIVAQARDAGGRTRSVELLPQ